MCTQSALGAGSVLRKGDKVPTGEVLFLSFVVFGFLSSDKWELEGIFVVVLCSCGWELLQSSNAICLRQKWTTSRLWLWKLRNLEENIYWKMPLCPPARMPLLKNSEFQFPGNRPKKKKTPTKKNTTNKEKSKQKLHSLLSLNLQRLLNCCGCAELWFVIVLQQFLEK
jgi:hypothetical protein